MAEVFTRYVYGLCSACTQAAQNSRQCEEIRKARWTSVDDLREALIRGGGGRHNEKAQAIWTFFESVSSGKLLLGHPVHNMALTGPCAWEDARDILDEEKWFGWKIASMCLQLACPLECPLLIVDTWFSRRGWYDIDPNKVKEYRAAEDHWNELCAEENWKHPGIAREVYWDSVGQSPHRDAPNSGWWASVLQGDPASPLLDKLRAIPYAPPVLP